MLQNSPMRNTDGTSVSIVAFRKATLGVPIQTSLTHHWISTTGFSTKPSVRENTGKQKVNRVNKVNPVDEQVYLIRYV